MQQHESARKGPFIDQVNYLIKSRPPAIFTALYGFLASDEIKLVAFFTTHEYYD